MSVSCFLGAACARRRGAATAFALSHYFLRSVAGKGRAGARAGCARRTAVRIHGRASRARRRLPLDWALTIVSTSMVVRTTIAAMAILSSVERPEATSMVSMVSIVPPTRQEAALVRRWLPRLDSGNECIFYQIASRRHLSRGFWDRLGSPWSASESLGQGRERFGPFGMLASVLLAAS